MYAEIAVYQAPVHRTFHYSIPDGWEVRVGQLVEVGFRTNRSQGIVLDITEHSPVAHAKPILEVLFSEPVVTTAQIALARWMAEYTVTPISACLWLNLPPGLAKRGDKLYTLIDADYQAEDAISQQVIALLRERGALRGAQLDRALRGEKWRPKLHPLIKERVVSEEAVLPAPDAKIQTIRTAQLAIPISDVDEALATLTRSPKQAQILQLLADHPDPVPTQEIEEALNTDSSVLRKLADKGLIRIENAEHIRDPLAGRLFEKPPIPILTQGQQTCWDQVRGHMERLADPACAEEGQTFLLHGVTGSGKTEVYLRALDLCLAQGRQAIVLVPEIALVPQTVQRFASRFPDRVSVIHSSLTDGEQYDTWRRARAGDFDVVIGARSALFTPLPDVGLIVIDEEHDDSYKQSPPLPPPYYHAREAAIAMMELNRGTVILGSATPTIITAFKAQRNEIVHLKLPNRVLVQDRPNHAHLSGLPPVEVVDMRQELRAGNRSMFSRALREELTQTLQRGEQAMLFLNRRGSATFILCRDCGYVAKCPRCEMPLTYHQSNMMLVCHACGHREAQLQTCPSCGGNRIKYFGAGTATVEEAVSKEFAPVRVLRWDRDTTHERGAHEQIMTRFAAGEADVLVGTQMIVKGLDLPRVTMVGVVLADTALGLPDYRAGERTFQLLTQAAGRAGRAALAGRVVFQTYQPEHYAIQAASGHDYETFYGQEIEYRRALRYPPFKRLVRLLFRHDSPQKVQQEAERAADWLRQRIAEAHLTATDLIGPAPTFFGQTADVFSWHIIARTTDPVALIEDFPTRAGCYVDIDPIDIL
ncbi:MAG: primosomal protein N' [Anaerolineae bacterium]|nr:primosomal protein N' [Anaerolineae bacterium]